MSQPDPSTKQENLFYLLCYAHHLPAMRSFPCHTYVMELDSPNKAFFNKGEGALSTNHFSIKRLSKISIDKSRTDLTE